MIDTERRCNASCPVMLKPGVYLHVTDYSLIRLVEVAESPVNPERLIVHLYHPRGRDERELMDVPGSYYGPVSPYLFFFKPPTEAEQRDICVPEFLAGVIPSKHTKKKGT